MMDLIAQFQGVRFGWDVLWLPDIIVPNWTASLSRNRRIVHMLDRASVFNLNPPVI